ncbi:MAG TPA: hypothetical protein VGE02_06725, partial [Gemmatimonadales bacterium]
MRTATGRSPRGIAAAASILTAGALLGAPAGPLAAQDTPPLVVRVVDAGAGAPVAGATVRVTT